MMRPLKSRVAKVVEWVRRQLGRSRTADAAWDPYLQREANALSRFQNRCNEALQKELFYFEGIGAAQRVEGDKEKYIIGVIPKTKIEYRIYPDAAQIGAYYYLDRQAFGTPELLIKSFVKMVKESTQTGAEY